MKLKFLTFIAFVLAITACKKDSDSKRPSILLESFDIISSPDKYIYLKEETLDLEGLRVKAVVKKDEINSTLYLSHKQLDSVGIACSPKHGDVLNTVGQTELVLRHAASSLSQSHKFFVHDRMSDVENNVYGVVKIGTQTWMAENLRTTKFNDNTNIPLFEDNTEWLNTTGSAYSWYDNDKQYADTNKYGALYNWYAVNTGKLCPVGWHVATKEDWEKLFNYVSQDGHLGRELVALRALKAWNWVETNGTDDYAFTLLPNGYRTSWDGGFYSAGSDLSGRYASYWSSSERIGFSVNDYENDKLDFLTFDENQGCAVRCVKD